MCMETTSLLQPWMLTASKAQGKCQRCQYGCFHLTLPSRSQVRLTLPFSFLSRCIICSIIFMHISRSLGIGISWITASVLFFLSTGCYARMSQAVNFSAIYSIAMKFDRVFALLLQTLLIYIFALDAAHVFCNISLQLAFMYAIYIYKYTYSWIV